MKMREMEKEVQSKESKNELRRVNELRKESKSMCREAEIVRKMQRNRETHSHSDQHPQNTKIEIAEILLQKLILILIFGLRV